MFNEVVFRYKGNSWTGEHVMDSVQDGICTKCKEVSYGHEPDATDNFCEWCGAKAVRSIAVLMGII